jgi:hypothetical protein
MRLELSAGQNLDVVTQLLSEPRCDAKTEPSTLTFLPALNDHQGPANLAEKETIKKTPTQ